MIASLVILGLAVLALLAWWIARPVHSHGTAGRGTPLPLFGVRTPGRGVRIVGALASAAGGAAARAGDWARSDAPRPPTAAPPPPPQRNPASANGDGRTSPVTSADAPPSPAAISEAPREVAGARPAAGREPAPLRTATDEGEPLDDADKWGRPAAPAPQGTVQFLPGRLEVVQGRGVLGQEVRFVRPDRPGERAVVTFGRGEGPPYRHVQLNVPTVSRLHARMSFDGATGAWMLENLSATNPVVVNGAELREGEAPRPLSNFDRVEMGEVVFTFRAR